MSFDLKNPQGVGKMKKNIPTSILTIAILIMFCQISWATKPYVFLEHVHTKSTEKLENNTDYEQLGCSDGSKSITEVADDAKGMAFDGVLFSDHTDLMIKSGNYDRCRSIVNSLNEEDYFVTIFGREITVNNKTELMPDDTVRQSMDMNSNCHINAFSFAENQYEYNVKYSPGQVNQVAKILNDEGAFFCLNHIKDCPAWNDSIKYFPCMELFNDIAWDPTRMISTVIKDNYGKDIEKYLKNIQAGRRINVVGGMDLHNDVQYLFGSTKTFIFADALKQRSIMDALNLGQTIAGKNLDIIDFTPYPSKITQELPNRKVEIKAALLLPSDIIDNPPSIVFYKNGVLFQTRDLKVEDRIKGIFSFDFADVLTDYKDVCYNIELPQYMMTSPFCFSLPSPKMPDTGSIPNRGVKFEKINNSNLSIKNSQLIFTNAKTLNKELAVEFCLKGFGNNQFIMNSKELIGCYDSFFSIAKDAISDKEFKPVFVNGDRMRNYIDGDVQEDANRIQIFNRFDAYAIYLQKDDYRLWFGNRLFTTNDNVKVGDHFLLCDNDGPFQFQGNTVSMCNAIAEFVYSDPSEKEDYEGKYAYPVKLISGKYSQSDFNSGIMIRKP